MAGNDDDDEKKRPAEKRGTKRKQPASDSTIWDTVDGLHDYPLVRVALEMFEENIDLCMSGSFFVVDKKDTTDHHKVIRNLKGVFAIDENNLFPDSYATCGISPPPECRHGVYFNKALAERSNQILEEAIEAYGGDVDRMAEDITLIGILAALQQSAEHEIIHYKYHNEGINDQFVKKTPTKNDPNHKEDTPADISLDGEAGYATQRQIRFDFFGERNRQEPTIIGINEHLTHKKKQFSALTYRFQFSRIQEDKGGKQVAKPDSNSRFLELKDIVEHMDYPKGRKQCSSEDDFGGTPPTGEEGKPRGEGGGGSDRGSGGGSGGGSGSGLAGGQGTHRQPNWLDSVKTKLKQAMIDAESAWNPPEFALCSKPETEFNIRDQSAISFDLDDDDLNAAIALCQQCKIKIIPCDENWKERNEFAPNDKIFVKVRITNETEKLVLVQLGQLGGSGFGNGGIQIKFTNIQIGYTRGRENFCIPIEPGKTYTLWRHFTYGDQRDSHCAYVTPQKPGTYTLCSEYYRKQFDDTTEIQIVENDHTAST